MPFPAYPVVHFQGYGTYLFWSILYELDPDFVMLGVGGALDASQFPNPQQLKVVVLKRADLQRAVTPEYRRVHDEGLRSYQETGLDRVGLTAAILVRFLLEQDRYQILAVHYAGGLHHIYGFKKELPQLQQLIRWLRDTSNRKLYRSYFGVKRMAPRVR